VLADALAAFLGCRPSLSLNDTDTRVLPSGCSVVVQPAKIMAAKNRQIAILIHLLP
jgi:hypothetical protein